MLSICIECECVFLLIFFFFFFRFIISLFVLSTLFYSYLCFVFRSEQHLFCPKNFFGIYIIYFLKIMSTNFLLIKCNILHQFWFFIKFLFLLLSFLVNSVTVYLCCSNIYINLPLALLSLLNLAQQINAKQTRKIIIIDHIILYLLMTKHSNTYTTRFVCVIE